MKNNAVNQTTKDFETRIKKYVRNHGENPNQKLCPSPIMTWVTSKGRKYLDLKTGKFMNIEKVPDYNRYTCRPQRKWEKDDSGRSVLIEGNFLEFNLKNPSYTIKDNTHALFPYIRCDFNLKIVEMSTITIDQTRRTIGPRKFKFEGIRNFVDMNDKSLTGHITAGKVYRNPANKLYDVAYSFYGRYYYTNMSTWVFVCANPYHPNPSAWLQMYYWLKNGLNIDKIYLGNNSYRSIEFASDNTFSEWLKRKYNHPVTTKNKDEAIKLITKTFNQLKSADDLGLNKKGAEWEIRLDGSSSKKSYRYFATTLYESLGEDISVIRLFTPYGYKVPKDEYVGNWGSKWRDSQEPINIYGNISSTEYMYRKGYDYNGDPYYTNDGQYIPIDIVFDHFVEKIRIYIVKGKLYYFENTKYTRWPYSQDDDWSITTRVNPAKDLYDYTTFYNPDELFEDNNFKYYKSCFYDKKTNKYIWNKDNQLISLIQMKTHPIIEQLAKIECNNLVDFLIADSQYNANLKLVVGEKNAKKKMLKDVFGLNISQIKYFNNMAYKYYLQEKGEGGRNRYYSSSLKRDFIINLGFLFELLGSDNYCCDLNNISDISDDSFKSLIDMYICLLSEGIIHRPWWATNSRYFNNTQKIYANTFDKILPPVNLRPESMVNSNSGVINYISKCCKLLNGSQVKYNIITDTFAMYRRLLGSEFEPTNIDFNFKSLSDITRLHDSLVELQNLKEEEDARIRSLAEDERNRELEKRMAKIDKNRRKYEYEEEDDDYIIKLPVKLSELTTEGVVQHMCIGSYINRHSSGESNILFLRKKSDPDTPFFAIEVNNDKVIQIHGFGNKWLGSDDESFKAVPFVMRWLKEKDIHCDDRILTSTATGYSDNCTYRELPTI